MREDLRSFRSDYQIGEPDAIEEYCELALERAVMPTGFPHTFELVFNGDSGELVVQYELPTLDVIPSAREYRYIQSGDRIADAPMKPKERAALYENVVAQVTLR